MKSISRDLMVFLVCSTVYRLFSGALLVSLTWTLLNNSDGGYLPLALGIFCSFIPAFVTPFIIKRLSVDMNGRKMSSLFLICLAGLALIAGGFRDVVIGLLVANLLVWLMFMLLEASLDMWFTQVQQGMDQASIRRISGATTATSQAALMMGPLLAAGLIPALPGMGFSGLLAGCFLCVALVCHAPQRPRIKTSSSVALASAPPLPLTLFIPMVLIWPILGAFNFMLPVYVAGQGWGLFELGLLDAVFGMGMAVIGVLIAVNYTAKNLVVFLISLIVLGVLSAVVWWAVPDTLALKAMGLLLLGMAFGGGRVHIRAAIAIRYSEAAVGLCVSRANALATPVLFFILTFQVTMIHSAWFVPFLLITLSLVLLLQASATRFVKATVVGIPPAANGLSLSSQTHSKDLI